MQFFYRSLLALSLLTTVLANPLEARQSTNTNPQINQIVDSLDESIHINIPNIQTLQASHTASDDTLGPQFTQLVTAFQTAANDIGNITVSSGDTTDFPTNDDISITFSAVLSAVGGGLSGLTTAMASTLDDMFADLDPAIAASITALNTTLPGSVNLVHIMMLDARQFFGDEGMTETLTALGF